MLEVVRATLDPSSQSGPDESFGLDNVVVGTNASTVPLPDSMTMLGLGVVGLAALRTRDGHPCRSEIPAFAGMTRLVRSVVLVSVFIPAKAGIQDTEFEATISRGNARYAQSGFPEV